MGNYHLISTKIGTQTKKSTPSSRIIRAEVHGHFQNGHRGFLGNSNACFKMGICRPFSMKFDTQTKTDMLSSKVTKRKCAAKKLQKLNVKTISI
jgi:hypothetical protein